jgi:hypothetical protein
MTHQELKHDLGGNKINAISKWLLALTFLTGPLMGSMADAGTIVYDTITGNSYGGGGQWFGYNPPYDSTYVLGDKFVATISGRISALETSMFTDPFVQGAGRNSVTLGVYTDNAGTIGTLVEALTVTTSGNYGTFASGSYSVGATLHAGQAYWIVTPVSASLTIWQFMIAPTPQPRDSYINLTAGTVGSLRGGTYDTSMSTSVLGLQVTMTSPVSLATLLTEVTGVGPGRSLARKVALAQTYYAAKDVQATCAMLTAFENEVEAQAGKKIDRALDAKLIADANAIEVAIGCH